MTLDKARKRGPKGPRPNYEQALQWMDPLVRRGMSISAAAREAIREGIAPVPYTEVATVNRLRTLFQRRATQPPVRQEVNIAYTLEDRAWNKALWRATVRHPSFLSQLVRQPSAIPDRIWERIRTDARNIEREMRLRELHKILESERALEKMLESERAFEQMLESERNLKIMGNADEN